MAIQLKENQGKVRARQVGFLTKAYRESFLSDSGRRGMSQSELLQRMAAINSYYGKISSHGTVSRWESGDTRPTVERLQTFGLALNLTEEEVEGLIVLAGLDPEHQETRTLTCPSCNGETKTAETRKMTGDEAAVILAVRTRRCLYCEFTAQSVERWAHDPEETAERGMDQIIRRIERANGHIREALEEAKDIRRPKPEGEQDPANDKGHTC